MTTWAIIPAKGFGHAKSRLAPVLIEAERARFAQRLFEHVVDTVAASGCVDGILVATNADDVAATAHRRGALVRRDAAPASLASIVDDALLDLRNRGATAALVLMADLPRLKATDVRAVLAALADHQVVLVPDLHGRHTNALALAPPSGLATRFGAADSLIEHLAAARTARLRVKVLTNAGIAFDVDGPAEHAQLQLDSIRRSEA